MLDPQGFVATCNCTHFFVVRRGEVWTSSGAYCLGGITRGNVLRVCARGRDPQPGEALQPDRGLLRRRGVRDRDVRRRRPGAHRRRPDDRLRPSRTDGRRGCRSSTPTWSARDVAARSRPDDASGSPAGPARATSRRRTMRAWENRPDTEVVDEPLYAWYLAHTGLDHPGRDEVIAAGETDWRRVVESLTAPWPEGPRAVPEAHGAAPRPATCRATGSRRCTNVLLIRDPAEVVASYLRSRASVAPDDIGILQQLELLRPARRTRPRDRLRRLPARRRRPTCAGCARTSASTFTDAMLSLAGRAARQRRRLGAVLVRRRAAVHRLRAVPSPPGRAHARGRGGRRRHPPGVRAAARRPAGAVSAGSLGRPLLQATRLPPRYDRSDPRPEG